MRITNLLLAVALLVGSQAASADWHGGRIMQLNFAYDGSTITFILEGWNRTNCTCYPAWPATMCLDRTRASFKEEFAWLLKARAIDQVINAYIDETTCKVIALYENG